MITKDIPWCNRSMALFPFFTVVRSPEDFKVVLKHLGVGEDRLWLTDSRADATTHYFERDGKRTCVVCINIDKGRSLLEILGLLAHEAVHIYQELLAIMRETRPSSEFEAYTIQHIFQELAEALGVMGGERVEAATWDDPMNKSYATKTE